MSIRDCVVTLPLGHPLKQWAGRKHLQEQSATAKLIGQALDTELANAWGAAHALTTEERQALIQLLATTETSPPYFDLTLLRAVAYLKLGNWVRTEKLLADWVELDPILRIGQTPWRNDPAGERLERLVPVLLDTLTKGLEGRVVVELFLRAVEEFVTHERVREQARDVRALSDAQLLEKIGLRYHRNLTPGFSAWLMGRYATGPRLARFVDAWMSSEDWRRHLWVFLGWTPYEARHREALARELVLQRESSAHIFFSLATDEELQAMLRRLSPESTAGLIQKRRSYYLARFRANAHDAWALTQLVSLGQIDEAMVRELLK